MEEIILLGNEALKITGLESKPKINLIIATSYHYLGNYQQTIELAKESLKILEENCVKKQDQKARSFYLISAGYRSLAIGSNELEKDCHSKKSHEYIEYALNLIKESELEEFTKAKIYFNAGALYQDVDGDNEQAIECYMKAEELFQLGDDFNRTKIRHTRALLEAGNLYSANIQAENLAKIIKLETKTGIHLLQLQAKIFLKLEQYRKAFNYTSKALEIAEHMIEYLKKDNSVLAIITDKKQKLSHTQFEIIEKFNLSKRRINMLRYIDEKNKENI